MINNFDTLGEVEQDNIRQIIFDDGKPTELPPEAHHCGACLLRYAGMRAGTTVECRRRAIPRPSMNAPGAGNEAKGNACGRE